MKCEREFTWAVAARPHAADLAPSPPNHQPRFAVHAIDALVVHMLSCLIEHDLEPPVAPARLLPRRDPIEWTHPGTCEAISFAAVRGGTSMKIATVKQVFQVHAADSEGRPVLRKRFNVIRWQSFSRTCRPAWCASKRAAGLITGLACSADSVTPSSWCGRFCGGESLRVQQRSIAFTKVLLSLSITIDCFH